MIQLIDLQHENIVAFRASGMVTKKDVKLVLSAMREAINSTGSVSLLIVVDSFCGFRLGVIPAKIKYLLDMGLSGIDNIAVVTDKKWIRLAAKVENFIFRSFELKAFRKKDHIQAWMFLDPSLDEELIQQVLVL